MYSTEEECQSGIHIGQSLMEDLVETNLGLQITRGSQEAMDIVRWTVGEGEG